MDILTAVSLSLDKQDEAAFPEQILGGNYHNMRFTVWAHAVFES